MRLSPTISMWRSSGSIHRKGRGFTLIEVLVVVAIIALLVAILIPSLKRAREQARIVQCAAHLHVIGQALVFYLEANDDLLPASGAGGFENLHKYVQKVAPGTRPELVSYADSNRPFVNIEWYLCPGDKFYHSTSEVELKMPDGQLVKAQYALSYGMNVPLSYRVRPEDDHRKLPKGAIRGITNKMSVVKRPSDTVSYCDYGNDDCEGFGPWVLNESNTPKVNQVDFEIRHGNGGNFLYCDSHVQYHKALLNSPPQYGLPPFPQAWIPGWKRGDDNGKWDDWVRPEPVAKQTIPYYP